MAKRYIEVNGCHNCPESNDNDFLDDDHIWCFKVNNAKMAMVDEYVDKETFNPNCSKKWAKEGEVKENLIRKKIEEKRW